MWTERIEIEFTGPTTAYVRLPEHPGDLRGGKQTQLRELLGRYEGPDVIFDFDKEGRLVGIEILGDDDDDDAAAAAGGS
jgi:hypothetical protein